MKKNHYPQFIVLLLMAAVPAMASGSNDSYYIIETVTNLVIQLGIITVIVRTLYPVFRTLGIPSVLGELTLGMIIGPYLLGAVPFWGFPQGVFPLVTGGAVSVSSELYGIATIASVVLLFMSGLETDITLLLRYSVTGAIVGIGGVVLSFAGGMVLGSHFLDTSFFDPRVLFLGVINTATSVGITARVLSERRKMDSAEGVTILASAVIDDVLGIILLAVVASLSAAAATGSGAEGVSVVGIAIRAILVWLGFTAAGIVFAAPLSRAVKKLKSTVNMAIFSFGMALALAGMFEKVGLAMIIGAYVMGLSFSKTDLNDTLRDTLEVINEFFVPVFFVVMGMMVNVGELLSYDVLLIGGLFSLIALAAKMVGCGVPALFLNFNLVGALRVGMGMVPRGEVALIIAGIGLSAGIIGERMFGASIIMTLVTTIIAPPILSFLFKLEKRGTQKEVRVREVVSTEFDFSDTEFSEMLIAKVIQSFRNEGFFINSIPVDAHLVYYLRRDTILITIGCSGSRLEFQTDRHDVIFVKTVVYETLVELNRTINNIEKLIHPRAHLKGLTEDKGRGGLDIVRVIDSSSIIAEMKSANKNDAIRELVCILCKDGKISDKGAALTAVMAREQSMSTGMQYGVALPHAKTVLVEKVVVAVGISREGIDFESIDGEPSRIFILVLSPLNVSGPHIQFLASISALLNSAEAREALLACKTESQIELFLKSGLGKKGRDFPGR